MRYIKLFILSFIFMCIIQYAYSQASKYVVDVKAPNAKEKNPLSISVQLTQNANIQKVILHYRGFGASEYIEQEMIFAGRTAVATIPAKYILPPFIEYYISMNVLGEAKVETFPSENPEVNPIKINVEGLDPKDAEVRLLSPDEGETLASEDLVIAASLMFISDRVDKNKTKIYINNEDVTSGAIISDDVILYNPNNFNKTFQLGTQSIKIVLYDTTGKVYHTKSASFNLSTATAIEEERTSFKYNGNGQLELRNEKIDVRNASYIRGNVNFNSTYKEFVFGTNLHVTNEEKSYRQPQNRFSVTATAGDYAKLQIGDAYPVFPSLIVSGKRVRGLTGSVMLGTFNLDVSFGKTDRAIEGDIIKDSTFMSADTIGLKEKDGYYYLADTTYRLFSSGTYARNFFAIRPSFGSGENFQIGLTYLRVKDDVSSIRYGENPQDNFVAGLDFLLAFDNQKIKWMTQTAISFKNTDIEHGNLSDAEIDDIKGVNDTSLTPEARNNAKKEADDLKKIAKIARTFITVNENLTPIDPLKGTPSLAYESELTLNYYNNYIRAALFRRGISYSSFGNDFIQADISGINISDRIRLFENKALVSISYELKQNNTINDANTPTTKYNTFNTSVTAYPSLTLPSVTVGYTSYSRTNPVDYSMYSALGKPLLSSNDTSYIASWDSLSTQSLYTVIPSNNLPYLANDKTHRFFIGMNYDFNYLIKHSASLTMSFANKKDYTFYKRDQKNMSLNLSVTSSFNKIPLQTVVSFLVSNNSVYAALQDSVRAFLTSTSKSSFNYQTLALNGRYRLMNDELILTAGVAPSFGNFKRMLAQAGAEYQVAERHYLIGQFDFIKNSGRESDIIISLLYRMMF